MVVLSTLILGFLELAAATHPLVVRRPLSTSRRSPTIPNIPVKKDVHRAPLRVHQRASRLVGRSIVGIQNVAYSQTSYNVLLSVGNIPFYAALDTGSADFWLVSDACQSSECKGTPAFPLKSYASPTFSSVDGNQTAFNVSFADGTGASGFVARETVSIDTVQTTGQAFGLVTSNNVSLGQSVSGVFGLGFPRLSQIAKSTSNAPPFFSALAELGELTYPLFGLSLTWNTNGTLSMGAIDASIVPNVSMISWHDVVPFAPLPGENATSLYLNWALPLNNVTVNGTSIPLNPTYPSITGPSPLALLDVGNNGIYGPFQDVAAIFTALGSLRQAAEGVWTLPCNIKSTMTFSFAGTNVTLQPHDYLIGPTQGDPNLCLSWPMASAPRSDGLDWHLGTPFLRTVYSVYSFGIAGHESPLIGLYPLSNVTTVTDTPAELSSVFSSLSATVHTTVPAVLLPTPSFTTPPYAFNTSATPSPTLGQTSPSQTDGGASTYSSLFVQGETPGLAFIANATAFPTADPSPTLATLIVTDSGTVRTITSTASTIPTALLGKPPGSKSSACRTPTAEGWVVLGLGLVSVASMGWTWLY